MTVIEHISNTEREAEREKRKKASTLHSTWIKQQQGIESVNRIEYVFFLRMTVSAIRIYIFRCAFYLLPFDFCSSVSNTHFVWFKSSKGTHLFLSISLFSFFDSLKSRPLPSKKNPVANFLVANVFFFRFLKPKPKKKKKRNEIKSIHRWKAFANVTQFHCHFLFKWSEAEKTREIKWNWKCTTRNNRNVVGLRHWLQCFN